MSIRPKPLTLAFYIAFSLWVTATRYSGSSFYSWLVSPVVESALGLGTLALFLIAVILAARRAISTHSIPWLDIAVVGGAIVGFDLFWRFYLSPLAWDAFKLTSIAIDGASPLILALGLAAVVSEFSRPAQVVAP